MPFTSRKLRGRGVCVIYHITSTHPPPPIFSREALKLWRKYFLNSSKGMPFTSRKLRGGGVCVYIVHICSKDVITALSPGRRICSSILQLILCSSLGYALRESVPHSRLIWNINQWNSIHATDCLLFCSTTPPGGPQSPVPLAPIAQQIPKQIQCMPITRSSCAQDVEA